MKHIRIWAFMLIAVLCLVACAPAEQNVACQHIDPQSTTHSINETAPPTSTSVPVETILSETITADSFELTEEMISLNKENCPESIGDFVTCPKGYLVTFEDPHNPATFIIVDEIDPETEFKVLGIDYLDSCLGEPHPYMESTPPLTREYFENLEVFEYLQDPENPEDPDDFEEFDYFEYLGAADPINRQLKGMLYIRQNETSPIYCVPPWFLRVSQ